MAKDSKEEIRAKIIAIKKIYSDFLSEMDKLKKEQREIIYKYIKKEEEEKIGKIRKSLNNN